MKIATISSLLALLVTTAAASALPPTDLKPGFPFHSLPISSFAVDFHFPSNTTVGEVGDVQEHIRRRGGHIHGSCKIIEGVMTFAADLTDEQEDELIAAAKGRYNVTDGHSEGGFTLSPPFKGSPE